MARLTFWLLHAAFSGEFKGHLARGDELSVEGMRDGHVQAAAGVHVQSAALRIRIAEDHGSSLCFEVSIFARNVQWLQCDGAVGK
jgi:hypothetical protein